MFFKKDVIMYSIQMHFCYSGCDVLCLHNVFKYMLLSRPNFVLF